MHFTSSIIALALPSLTSVVLADSCNRGGVYCGQSLLNKGNYRDHIVSVLRAVGSPTDETHIQNSLFTCQGGGEITYQGFCAKGCGGVNTLDPDFCLA